MRWVRWGYSWAGLIIARAAHVTIAKYGEAAVHVNDILAKLIGHTLPRGTSPQRALGFVSVPF